jgi:peptide deformylase
MYQPSTSKIKRELSALLAMNDHIEVTSLAANQLSYMLRAMTYKHEQTVKLIINPRILEISDFSFKWEQNLSFPFMKAFIGRYNSVKVSYVDRNFDELEETFSGEDARKVQQAFDQLNGFTLLDCRISRGEWALTDTFDKMVKTAKVR